MISIGGVWYTLSEIIQMIKHDPDTVWHKSYPHYLLKIANSGDPNFPNFLSLILRLADYHMGEIGKTGVHLERYRGRNPTPNSAMCQQPIARNKVDARDVAAINSLMNTGTTGNGVTNNSAHQTDPETGFPKPQGVGVTEFYINGADGRRAVKRTQHNKTTYYYSLKHTEKTYTYQRLL